MSKLSWISDEDLNQALMKFRNAATSALDDAKRRQQKNVIDPFLSLLIAATFGIDSKEDLTRFQESESAVRGMSNALGHFHQDVLSGVEGWVEHDAGYDLECESKKTIAEIKNKHNTMNASNRDKVVGDLDTAVRVKGRGWEGFLVIVIPKTSKRYSIRLNTQRPVYEIDGASFYHKVTGQSTALHDLFDVLCDELTESQEIADYCQELMKTTIPR